MGEHYGEKCRDPHQGRKQQKGEEANGKLKGPFLYTESKIWEIHLKADMQLGCVNERGSGERLTPSK